MEYNLDFSHDSQKFDALLIHTDNYSEEKLPMEKDFRKSISKLDKSTLDKYFDKPIKIGHRGISKTFKIHGLETPVHENTIEMFKMANKAFDENKLAGIEFDLKFTTESGDSFIFHDDEMIPSHGSKETIAPESLSITELKSKKWMCTDFEQNLEKDKYSKFLPVIPTFEELLSTVNARMFLDIEVKTNPDALKNYPLPEQLSSIYEAFQNRDSFYMISSFNVLVNILASINNLCPVLYLISRDCGDDLYDPYESTWKPTYENILLRIEYALHLGFSGIGLDYEDIQMLNDEDKTALAQLFSKMRSEKIILVLIYGIDETNWNEVKDLQFYCLDFKL